GRAGRVGYFWPEGARADQDDVVDIRGLAHHPLLSAVSHQCQSLVVPAPADPWLTRVPARGSTADRDPPRSAVAGPRETRGSPREIPRAAPAGIGGPETPCRLPDCR